MSLLHRAPGDRPRVYGHRGAPRLRPENTLAGFELALRQGADGVELDVRLCASGEVVVIHDRDLQRVAGDPGVVAELSLAELQARDLGAGERVPTLDAVIDLVRGLDRAINIEVKSDVPDPLALCAAVARCVSECSARDRQLLFLSSFHPVVVYGLRGEGVGIPIGFLFEQRDVGEAGIAALSPEGVHPDQQITSESDVIAWRNASLFVNVWTVNDPARTSELSRWGVDGIITDDVPSILNAL